MKKEITVGIVVALIVSIIGWFVTITMTKIDDDALNKIVKELRYDDKFHEALLDKFTSDPDFKGDNGKDGKDGKNGATLDLVKEFSQESENEKTLILGEYNFCAVKGINEIHYIRGNPNHGSDSSCYINLDKATNNWVMITRFSVCHAICIGSKTNE